MLSPVGPDILEHTATLTNAQILTSPWTNTERVQRHRDIEVEAAFCSQNNRDAPIGDKPNLDLTPPSPDPHPLPTSAEDCMMPGPQVTRGTPPLTLALSAAAFAHHSAGRFDPAHTETVKGTVKAFEGTNPHVWLWVTANDSAGQTKDWGIECANLVRLRRAGLSRESVKPGDPVSVDIHPLKDGRLGGMFIKLRFADGHVFDMSPSLSEATLPTTSAPGP